MTPSVALLGGIYGWQEIQIDTYHCVCNVDYSVTVIDVFDNVVDRTLLNKHLKEVIEMTGQEFDRLVSQLKRTGMDKATAAMTASLMRKPNREKALLNWMTEHPKATGSEIAEQAEKIAQTVEPTRHGTPKE